MKSLIYLSSFIFFLSCNPDNVRNNNPYLPDYKFNTGNLINTNLPQYSILRSPGSSIIVSSAAPNYLNGINGFVLYFAGNGNYNAFEITDPNHALSTCSKLSIQGIIATCDCADGNSYDILNGIRREGTTGEFPLIRYQVEVSGNIIRVFND